MKVAIRFSVVALVVACGFFAGCSGGDQGLGSTAAIGAQLRVAPPTTASPSQIRLGGDPATRDALPAREPRSTGAVRSTTRAAATVGRPAVIGRIEIPSIGVSEDYFEGVDDHTLKFGPGHWEVTAMPGQVGNATFGGHRTTFTQPFHDIDKIAIGDEVIFTTAAGRFVYRATDHFVVRENDVWIGEPTTTPTFTLFACHPKGSSKQRYVVKGELVPESAAPAPAPETENGANRPLDPARGCLLCKK